jgi:hypothetical protein
MPSRETGTGRSRAWTGVVLVAVTPLLALFLVASRLPAQTSDPIVLRGSIEVPWRRCPHGGSGCFRGCNNPWISREAWVELRRHATDALASNEPDVVYQTCADYFGEFEFPAVEPGTWLVAAFSNPFAISKEEAQRAGTQLAGGFVPDDVCFARRIVRVPEGARDTDFGRIRLGLSDVPSRGTRVQGSLVGGFDPNLVHEVRVHDTGTSDSSFPEHIAIVDGDGRFDFGWLPTNSGETRSLRVDAGFAPMPLASASFVGNPGQAVTLDVEVPRLWPVDARVVGLTRTEPAGRLQIVGSVLPFAVHGLSAEARYWLPEGAYWLRAVVGGMASRPVHVRVGGDAGEPRVELALQHASLMLVRLVDRKRQPVGRAAFDLAGSAPADASLDRFPLRHASNSAGRLVLENVVQGLHDGRVRTRAGEELLLTVRLQAGENRIELSLD